MSVENIAGDDDGVHLSFGRDRDDAVQDPTMFPFSIVTPRDRIDVPVARVEDSDHECSRSGRERKVMERRIPLTQGHGLVRVGSPKVGGRPRSRLAVTKTPCSVDAHGCAPQPPARDPSPWSIRR